MNRQFSREEIQKIVQRWHQLRNQFGEQAVNVPEFAHLSKIIKFLQHQNQQTLQRQQQQQGAPQQSQPQLVAPQAQANTLSGSLPNQTACQQNNLIDNNTNRVTTNIQGSNLIGQSNVIPNEQPTNNVILPQHSPQQPSQPFPHANVSTPSNNESSIPPTINQPTESPFTPQQFQLVKAQYQALKFLLKNPGAGSPPIPQNLIDFITNDRSAFANGPYLPSANQHQQRQNQLQAQQQQLQVQPQPQEVQQPTQNIPQSQVQSQTQSSSQISAAVISNNQSPMIPMQQTFPQKAMNNIPASVIQEDTKKKGGKRGPKPKSPIQQYKKAPGTRPLLKEEQVPPHPSSVKPLEYKCLQPQPPVNVNELVPDKNKSNKIIVPINKPNIQVDCFEIPDLIGSNVKEISFNALYTPQSRFQFPGLFPDAINMDDIINNKEVLMILKIDKQITLLREKLDSINKDSDEERRIIETELSKLELLPFQKELRGKLLSQLWFSKSLLPNSHPNFLAKFNTLSIENVTATHDLYRRQLYSLLQAQNQKHQRTINKILALKEKKNGRFARKKEKLEKFSTKVSSFHNQTAKEEQKKLERMAKQRLQALKSNDEEAYLKLLDHTKDTRITHLLKQTNQFLDSLAQAVQTQQKETHNRVPQSGRLAKDGNHLEPTITDDEKREKLDYYHVAHRIKEEVTKQPSILVGGTLKEYQLKGLQWMVSLFNNHLNGILADEMGLGKTIQTISLITYLIEVKKILGPFLVIVPLSTLTNWNIEFDKWAPSVKKITYKGTPYQRKILQQDIKSGNFQILLTTFEYIIKDKTMLSKIKWVHMIIDEGHRMKNSNSKLSETLTHHYHSDYRLILTGTPLQNNLPELWALLNFVLPKIFNSVKSFDEWFNTPFANTGGQDKIELSEEETLLVIRRLHKVLRPFLLRRLKKDVEKDLPNKIEKVVKCKMSSLQSKLYQQMLKYNLLFSSDPENGDVPVMIKNANNQIMQLRKICNHPFVYEEVENLINPTAETNDQIWRVSGKFELLDKVLPKFKKTGHRVLIFFQMTQIMDIMEDFLRLRGLKYMRLDGGTKADDRTGLLKLFNAPNSEYFCFLLSTRAGGLGLNLQTADTVIIFDTDWNPHQDLQAQDRAHRIGQKNEVRILRLITEDSVEEMILERAHAKLEIDGKVIQAGKFDNKSTAEEQEALLRALIEKEEERKQKGNADEDEDLDDDELNQVIARNENELVVFRKLDEARAVETKKAQYPSRLFSEQELPEIYKKDPEVFLKKEEQIIEEYGRGTRERKAATYDDNLTEEQWLRKIDGMVSGDSDSDIEVKPKRARGRPRGKPKPKSLDEETSKEDTPEPPRSSTGSRVASKRKLLSEEDSVDDLSETTVPVIKRQRSSTPKSSTTRGRGRGRDRGRGRGRGSLLYRATPSVDPLSPEDRSKLQNTIETIYGLIINYKNGHGRVLSDIFLVKPSKKLYPDYYVLIKHPIALDIVKKRIFGRSYTQVREMLEDLHLMFSNAKIFNEEGSIVYQDAATLEKLAFEKFKELSTDLDEEEINKILDFTEFDNIFSLKPLTIIAAAKQTIVRKLEQLDNGESVDSPIEGFSTGLGTEDSTPFDFD